MEQNTVVKSHKGKKIASTVLTVLCVLFFLIAAFCSGIVIYEYFITLGTGNNLSYGIAFAVFIIPNIIACALQIVLFIVNIFLVRPIINDGDIKDKNYKWLTAICIALPLLVAFSRNYLGAHFITDVVCGLLLG
ncbi:MAG: phosphatase PAP2 family protein, partial [Clostridia bacterium]|nr:phosphatase PAP2 family protein [Clostridia bacterium]